MKILIALGYMEQEKVISDNFEEDDENFIEGAEYSPKSEFSKAGKVSEAVSRCLELRAKPMTEGYENTSQSSDGTIRREKIPDSRQAFISSVIALRCLLEPETRRDEKFKSFEEKMVKKLIKIKDKYSYEEHEFKGWENGKPIIKKTGRKFMPSIDSFLVTNVFDTKKSSLAYQKGYWNPYINAYWDKVLELYDRMFAQLNMVIDRLNYFKTKLSF